jgi:hypothetical protein
MPLNKTPQRFYVLTGGLFAALIATAVLSNKDIPAASTTTHSRDTKPTETGFRVWNAVVDLGWTTLPPHVQADKLAAEYRLVQNNPNMSMEDSAKHFSAVQDERFAQGFATLTFYENYCENVPLTFGDIMQRLAIESPGLIKPAEIKAGMERVSELHDSSGTARFCASMKPAIDKAMADWRHYGDAAMAAAPVKAAEQSAPVFSGRILTGNDDVGAARGMMIASLYDHHCEKIPGLEAKIRTMLAVIPASTMTIGMDQAGEYFRSMVTKKFCEATKSFVTAAQSL